MVARDCPDATFGIPFSVDMLVADEVMRINALKSNVMEDLRAMENGTQPWLVITGPTAIRMLMDALREFEGRLPMSMDGLHKPSSSPKDGNIMSFGIRNSVYDTAARKLVQQFVPVIWCYARSEGTAPVFAALVALRNALKVMCDVDNNILAQFVSWNSDGALGFESARTLTAPTSVRLLCLIHADREFKKFFPTKSGKTPVNAALKEIWKIAKLAWRTIKQSITMEQFAVAAARTAAIFKMLRMPSMTAEQSNRDAAGHFESWFAMHTTKASFAGVSPLPGQTSDTQCVEAYQKKLRRKLHHGIFTKPTKSELLHRSLADAIRMIQHEYYDLSVERMPGQLQKLIRMSAVSSVISQASIVQHEYMVNLMKRTPPTTVIQAHTMLGQVPYGQAYLSLSLDHVDAVAYASRHETMAHNSAIELNDIHADAWLKTALPHKSTEREDVLNDTYAQHVWFLELMRAFVLVRKRTARDVFPASIIQHIKTTCGDWICSCAEFGRRVQCGHVLTVRYVTEGRPKHLDPESMKSVPFKDASKKRKGDNGDAVMKPTEVVDRTTEPCISKAQAARNERRLSTTQLNEVMDEQKSQGVQRFEHLQALLTDVENKAYGRSGDAVDDIAYKEAWQALGRAMCALKPNMVDDINTFIEHGVKYARGDKAPLALHPVVLGVLHNVECCPDWMYIHRQIFDMCEDIPGSIRDQLMLLRCKPCAYDRVMFETYKHGIFFTMDLDGSDAQRVLPQGSAHSQDITLTPTSPVTSQARRQAARRQLPSVSPCWIGCSVVDHVLDMTVYDMRMNDIRMTCDDAVIMFSDIFSPLRGENDDDDLQARYKMACSGRCHGWMTKRRGVAPVYDADRKHWMIVYWIISEGDKKTMTIDVWTYDSFDTPQGATKDALHARFERVFTWFQRRCPMGRRRFAGQKTVFKRHFGVAPRQHDAESCGVLAIVNCTLLYMGVPLRGTSYLTFAGSKYIRKLLMSKLLKMYHVTCALYLSDWHPSNLSYSIPYNERQRDAVKNGAVIDLGDVVSGDDVTEECMRLEGVIKMCAVPKSFKGHAQAVTWDTIEVALIEIEYGVANYCEDRMMMDMFQYSDNVSVPFGFDPKKDPRAQKLCKLVARVFPTEYEDANRVSKRRDRTLQTRLTIWRGIFATLGKHFAITHGETYTDPELLWRDYVTEAQRQAARKRVKDLYGDVPNVDDYWQQALERVEQNERVACDVVLEDDDDARYRFQGAVHESRQSTRRCEKFKEAQIRFEEFEQHAFKVFPELKANLPLPEYDDAWMQCEEATCQKWRRVTRAYCDAHQDKSWSCSMNPDPAYASCSVKQEMSNEDIDVCVYTAQAASPTARAPAKAQSARKRVKGV